MKNLKKIGLIILNIKLASTPILINKISGFASKYTLGYNSFTSTDVKTFKTANNGTNKTNNIRITL